MFVAERLTFGFQRPLFSNLSFQVQPGQILHVRGANGSGKSTLLQILARLLKPQSGKTSFTSAPSHAGQHGDWRSVIEYLPAEGNGFFLKLNAAQNLRFWLQLRGHGADETLMHRELQRWQLDHPILRQSFPVEKFSTGMKRRLGLARVVLSQTPLWLLDEPLSGLDQKGIETFNATLQEHTSRGGMIILVSHDEQAIAHLQPRTLNLSQSGEAAHALV